MKTVGARIPCQRTPTRMDVADPSRIEHDHEIATLPNVVILTGLSASSEADSCTCPLASLSADSAAGPALATSKRFMR